MKKELNLSYEVHEDQSGLSDEDKALIIAAENVASRAYAPYSGFHVGAAVLLDDGEVVLGNNQENASFPAGICAERVAVFAAAVQHPGKRIGSIAITANNIEGDLKEPVPPCGICRQVVAEYEAEQNTPVRVLLSVQNGPVHIFDSMKDLLPFHFHETSLKR